MNYPRHPLSKLRVFEFLPQIPNNILDTKKEEQMKKSRDYREKSGDPLEDRETRISKKRPSGTVAWSKGEIHP